MLNVFLIAVALLTGLQAPTLPDTPQGRAVLEYVEAFNNGTEAAVVKMLEKYSTAEALKRRTPEQRSEAYRGLKELFGKLTINRVVRSSAQEIVVSLTRLDGIESWLTFAFEAGDPVRFSGITLKTAE